MYGEKSWRQLLKNTASNIEQVLETTHNKTAAVRPPTTHHENLDEPDMRDTAGKIRANQKAIYSRGPLHVDEQRQDNQLEPIYNSSVPIQDIALKTSRERWAIETGGERGSRRSVLVARHDDDDDDDDELQIFTCKNNDIWIEKRRGFYTNRQVQTLERLYRFHFVLMFPGKAWIHQFFLQLFN